MSFDPEKHQPATRAQKLEWGCIGILIAVGLLSTIASLFAAPAPVERITHQGSNEPTTPASIAATDDHKWLFSGENMVGVARIELATPAMSTRLPGANVA